MRRRLLTVAVVVGGGFDVWAQQMRSSHSGGEKSQQGGFHHPSTVQSYSCHTDVFPQTSSKRSNGDMRFLFQSTCRKTTEGMLVSVLQCIQNSLKIKPRKWGGGGINYKIKQKKYSTSYMWGSQKTNPTKTCWSGIFLAWFSPSFLSGDGLDERLNEQGFDSDQEAARRRRRSVVNDSF